MTSTRPLPREHGAWGLLLQPFVAGAILAREWNWLLLPALGLTLFGFLLREPLTVLARQHFVWRTENPQTRPALKWLAAEAFGAALCLAFLAPVLPVAPLAALTGVAVSLTAVAVWMTIRNKQRSIVLQLISAAGLGTTALLAVLACTGAIPAWAWPLWAVLTFHGAASILTVHKRLALKRAGGQPGPRDYIAPALGLTAAFAAPALALPLAFSALVNLWELYRLRSPQALQEPLKHVGLRALAVSITHSLLTVAALWRAANV
ncbi:MAG: YwiC-like family protein [Bryobacterales bacterium]|nr:YwiC-like family protein [Bryobacterales bacterium]